MLALCGKLIALELNSLASKELRALKKRLETALPSKRTTKAAGSEAQQRAEAETLSSLLQLDIDFEACSGAWPLLINLQLYALQLIAASPKPGCIEEILQFLESDSLACTTNLVLRQVKNGGDRIKSSKQLATLSRTILQLCPNVASSADEAAKDPTRSPSPLTVFNLQAISLQLRREIWRLEGRDGDVQKELVDPFSRCMAALVRRMPARKSNKGVFETCKGAYDTLNIANASGAEPSSSRFTISRTLSVLAGRASVQREALDFSERAFVECEGLGKDHARFVAALARRISIRLSEPSIVDDLCTDMDTVCESLRKSLSGSTSDYETLFAELADIVTKRHSPFECEQLEAAYKRMAGSVAGFTSSYVRSFPGKNAETAQEVIQVVLSQCGSNEALLGWVNRDTAQVLIQSGVLGRVAEKLSSRSMALAWASFSSAMTFSRILKLVVIKGAASSSSDPAKSIVDDKNLADYERGALLDYQLKCALELGHKSKYQAGLKSLLPEYFRRLATIYTVESHPLRRARVATQAYCMREQFPELVAPHSLAVLIKSPLTIDGGKLANDHSLAAYAPSIRASLELAAAFHSGHPTLNDLRSSLLDCENHIKTTEDAATVDQFFDNPGLLCAQLTSLHDYLELLGDDSSRLKAAKLLRYFGQAGLSGALGQNDGALRLSRTYISLGFAENAGEALSEAQRKSKTDETPSLETLDMLLCKAEYFLAMQDLSGCQQVLETINQTRQQLQSETPRSLQTSRFRMLLGRAWLLVSQWMFATGSAHDSLSAAKRAVKIMNSIWSGLERASQGSNSQEVDSEAEKAEAPVDNLTNKVSMLVLKPGADSPSQKKTTPKGAAFWPVAGLLCRSLTHLADVYIHHGVFNEANYSSEQAVKFAQGLSSSHIISRVRYHRSMLLTAAGQLEEAELCLAHDPNEDADLPPLVKMESFRAKAALSTKIGDLEEARSFYQQAETVIKEIQSEKYLTSIDGMPEAAASGQQTETTAKTESRRQPAVAPSRSKTATSQPRQKPATGRTAPLPKRGPKPPAIAAPKSKPTPSKARILERLEAMVLLDKILVCTSLGQSDQQSTDRLNDLTALLSDSSKRRRLEHESTMQKVYSEIQADFSFNVLPESTLSFPALQALDRRLSAIGSKGSFVTSPNANVPAKTVKRGKGVKPAAKSVPPLHDMLSTARRCVAPDSSTHVPLSTMETHRQYSLMANASMVLSATSATHAAEVLHPVQEALSIDYGRLHASECYSFVVRLDRDSHTGTDPLAWPEMAVKYPASPVTAKVFRDQYVDLLPRSWTAVSMSLNETCDELYIARYRQSQSPLIMRLPFSRQKTDEADVEVFDFHMGKEELKDIIELSNFSCHNSLDTNVKGAKTNWWNEREELDRRLQELLINIENIWIGGFKGIFSQHQREKGHLDRFRKSFEAIMDRHLPSRKSIKKGSKKLTLDDQVLELFIGLGSDQDGEVDLDESLADLLYFIVDILQFNGERNAYDEIDFDSMAIDVLDALRTYHDSIDQQGKEHQHLILVLDKRLQAFPWENLPCLEKCSVSRVDSMLTLRDRLAQMKQHSDTSEGHYEVSRRSGSYILNPASDLKTTETTLGPALSKLAASQEGGWTSIVGTAPSEDDFRQKFSDSSMLLYFGHGAGSQYIGQRQIRRLDKCSEVVWLMGCSSGAVTEYDELEPTAVPFAYLVAGHSSSDENSEQQDRSKCMAVVSNLWDVTDKDIDRFSLAVGEEWGLWRSEQESTKLPAKTPRKREKLAAPSTPERTAKTPKTPKVKKTPAPARTPARSGSRPRRGDGDRKQSLVEAVAKSRDACYLRYLNGAAPVVYGVPVYLGD